MKSLVCIIAIFIVVVSRAPGQADPSTVHLRIGGAAYSPSTTLHLGAEYRMPLGHGLFGGMLLGGTLKTPLQIVRSANGQETLDRIDGESTLTSIRLTGGWQGATGGLNYAVGLSVGGMNSYHYRFTGGYWSSTRYTQYFQTSFVAGAFGSIGYQFSPVLGLELSAGYDAFESSLVTVQNPEPYGSYTAVFGESGPWFSLGTRSELGGRDTNTASEPITVAMGFAVGSFHVKPQFKALQLNPGLFVHIRENTGMLGPVSLLAEFGAYQWGSGDFAVFMVMGAHVPLWVDWLKGGVVVGGIAARNPSTAKFVPTIAPRLTVEIDDISFTANYLADSYDPSIGFTVAFPLH